MSVTPQPDQVSAPNEGGKIKKAGMGIVKRILAYVGILIVLAIGGTIWANISGDVTTANVGDCISMKGDDANSAKVTDCKDAAATYKVAGIEKDKTRADLDSDATCKSISATTYVLWFGDTKSTNGQILCLAPKG